MAPGSLESLASPYGLTLTLNAAKSAINHFDLGKGEDTDVLTVSFSSHDYAGHRYGPNSREMEEMTVAEDATVANLLNFVRERMPNGLEDVVIVMTADHGMPAHPDYSLEHHIPAGRLSETDLTRDIEESLSKKFVPKKAKSKSIRWILFTQDLVFYFDRELIKKMKLDLAKVQAEAKAAISERIGVAYIITGSEFSAGKFPPGMFQRQAQHSYVPARSGDLMIIPRPNFMVGSTDAVAHHTGYAYDRTVPMILAGKAFRPGIYAREAEVVDIAPTLTFLLGTVPPSTTEGHVLRESLATPLTQY
jgi:arylsulfatase A-like enzyme